MAPPKKATPSSFRATKAANKNLAAQIARVDAYEQIRLLASRYALAIDTKNFDALVELYDEDFGGAGKAGLAAMLGGFAARQAQFTTTIHYVCNHVIDLDDADHAHGVVYTRAEHESRGRWEVLATQYWDTYVRRKGRWLFAAQRRMMPWYAVDLLERPNDSDFKMRWTLQAQGKPPLPEAWPAWNKFWESHPRPL